MFSRPFISMAFRYIQKSFPQPRYRNSGILPTSLFFCSSSCWRFFSSSSSSICFSMRRLASSTLLKTSASISSLLFSSSSSTLLETNSSNLLAATSSTNFCSASLCCLKKSFKQIIQKDIPFSYSNNLFTKSFTKEKQFETIFVVVVVVILQLSSFF